MLIRRKRKNIRVASRIQFCGGRPSAPEKGNIRRETLVLPCATYPETARPEAPLSKIFGDQIERVRFARTLRWREPDSNYRFSITRPRFQDRLMSPLPDSPPTEIRANESRHREDAGRLPRNRWFEACSLQRRVCCEPLHGATSVRTQSSSHRRSFRRVAAGSDPA